MDDVVIVAVLFATVLLRLAIILGVAYFCAARAAVPALPARDAALRHALLDRLLPGLQRRWCLECGWKRRGAPLFAASRDQPCTPFIDRYPTPS